MVCFGLYIHMSFGKYIQFLESIYSFEMKQDSFKTVAIERMLLYIPLQHPSKIWVPRLSIGTINLKNDEWHKNSGATIFISWKIIFWILKKSNCNHLGTFGENVEQNNNNNFKAVLVMLLFWQSKNKAKVIRLHLIFLWFLLKKFKVL